MSEGECLCVTFKMANISDYMFSLEEDEASQMFITQESSQSKDNVVNESEEEDLMVFGDGSEVMKPPAVNVVKKFLQYSDISDDNFDGVNSSQR